MENNVRCKLLKKYGIALGDSELENAMVLAYEKTGKFSNEAVRDELIARREELREFIANHDEPISIWYKAHNTEIDKLKEVESWIDFIDKY